MNKSIIILVLWCCLVNSFTFIPKNIVSYNGTLYVVKKDKKQPKYIEGLFSDVNIVYTIAFLLS